MKRNTFADFNGDLHLQFFFIYFYFAFAHLMFDVVMYDLHQSTNNITNNYKPIATNNCKTWINPVEMEFYHNNNNDRLVENQIEMLKSTFIHL